ncbi:MAG: hypothetical protein OXG44_11505 [Gammaproteobacteria bacterium]|nr:hypothetical protein [Gammaproteobacteria bacterium]
MSLLKIRKVSEAGEHCWGVELLDETGPLLRSREGASKDDVTSIATTLKSEGPAAPLLEDDKVQPGQAAWVIAKARGGWVVRFTPLPATSFDLLLKPETGVEPPKAAAEAMALVKKCLNDAEIVWQPPITIKIDSEPHQAAENPMSANDILRLGGLDPDSNYLVQIKDGERIKYDGKGTELIILYEGAAFVGHYTGSKGVSRLDGHSWGPAC